MTGRLRSSLWADVVLNLALLTVLTIALNAILLGKVVQGREADLRATVAGDLSRTLALRASDVARVVGAPDADQPRPFAEALAGADIPDGEPFFAVLASRDLRPVTTVGDWPPELAPDGASEADLEVLRAAWLMDAIDVRAAMSGRRTERSTWQPRASFFRGRAYAAVASPVYGDGRQPVASVRVVVPVGVPIFGPTDRHTLPVLGLSVLLSALGVGAFGYFLFRRRVLAPVEALAEGARDLGEGRFDTRLPDGAANELGAVADAFNEMAAALERYRRQSEARLAELREANADLGQAREDLIFAEKMATVGRMAAGVAHEVGNPLASVIGFVELLQVDADGELAEDLLPRIRTELDRIHRIIRDLLAYSRPAGASQAELNPVEVAPAVRIGDVVATAADLVAAQPRFAKVEFNVELPDELPEVLVPSDRLQQVLLNLFVNAAEAMNGNGQIRIHPIADPEALREGLVTVAVEDDGPGIDPRAGSNIYEPFFTTKEVGDGTGLGLAVSMRLVEKMGGRLRHLRDTAAGACFHLSLPVGDREGAS
jgi:two-component system, NtrC family, sensor kinase